MIVAGFGCRAEVSMQALQMVLEAARACLPEGVMIDALATVEHRQAQLLPLASALALPLIRVAAADLRIPETSTVSSRSLMACGCGSVAEAAAMVAAGDTARLLITRQISPDGAATCAIAQGAHS